MQTIVSTYQRVLPRDLFNEAKLLKCLGRLTLLIHDNNETVRGINFGHDGEDFRIVLTEDGHLMVSNLEFYHDADLLIFKTAYNSRGNWPLLMEFENCEYCVFDEDGNIDSELVEFLNDRD